MDAFPVPRAVRNNGELFIHHSLEIPRTASSILSISIPQAESARCRNRKRHAPDVMTTFTRLHTPHPPPILYVCTARAYNGARNPKRKRKREKENKY